MNVLYDDKVKEGGNGFALLQQGTKALEEVIGQSAGLVKAEWTVKNDAKGRALYTLRISDFTGDASADFAPYELQSSSQLRYRLHRLWGDLLQVRSHKLLEKLTTADDQGWEVHGAQV